MTMLDYIFFRINAKFRLIFSNTNGILKGTERVEHGNMGNTPPLL